ncbi:MAG: S9 family peptidase [Acidobacteria bacterium]|nr:S9 family peptidase [Acidobacteriota bacterium]
MLKFRFLIVIPVLASLGLIYPASSDAQARRGLLPTDLSTIKDVGDAQISPDGSRVVYVVSESTPDRSRMIARLWVVPTSGGESKRLTAGDANESTPRWSHDGKFVAFYSNRENRDGLWVVPAEGGEPKLVTRVLRTNFYLKSAGETFSWAPDGKRIAVLSSPEVLNEPAAAPIDPKLAGLPPQATRAMTLEEIEKLPLEVREVIFRAHGQAIGKRSPSPLDNALSVLPDDPRVITRLQYKSRTSFSDNLQSHIFIADIETRKLRQITAGSYYEHSINWSPKGDEIVFVSNHEPDPDRVNNTDLFTVNVNTFAVRQLTRTKGCEWQPAFSPDGNEIAYIGTKRELTTIDSVAEDAHAFVISTQGGVARPVSSGVDRRVSMFKWRAVGAARKIPAGLLFTVGDKGKTIVYFASGGKNPVVFLTRAAQITGLSVSQKADFAFTENPPAHSSEAYFLQSDRDANGAAFLPKKLTRVNQVLLDKLLLSTFREFKFSNDGFEIQGWVIPPINLDEKKKYPVILSIHGGPHGMFGYSFNPTGQALAAQGYAVLLINPRGSSGYGQKFADGCINDWGGGDYRDLMKGVDEALARFPFLDRDRMGVTGGSYGGYMTNWVVTQTDRFKAAVAVASLSNLISFYSTSLYQDLIHVEFNGYPWDNFEILWDRSPLKHIKKTKTPLLLLHGEQDNDVHITQAEEMYTALRMRGIDCVFVRYPREGHGFREPRHREDSLARAIQWFDRYLKK